jgi:hypothetical protein
MTQPAPTRVIYLPPGVVPTPAQAPQVPPTTDGVPFNRVFFETVLGLSIQSFCSQTDCTVPVVELTTVDGTTHYVNGISGVSDSWVALHTSQPDHDHPTQVFVPYVTIFRVEIHPEHDERRRHLGFVTGNVVPQPPPAPVRAVARTSRAAKAKK